MVSTGRDQRGRVKRFRVGKFASFQRAPGQKSCPYLSGTGLGQGDVGQQNKSLMKEVVGDKALDRLVCI